MSFDKEKVRRTAEKNLSQGKIQSAIRDYCQIAENDPKDYNTLNTLGDLYVRVEAKEEGIACFTRIAEHYNTQGFSHKAIAMYKKILRLKPTSIEIAAKLAPLYQTLGLVAEARAFYLTVAEHHQKSGEQLKALETWSRIADLDPNDTTTRLKLAESFLKENQPEKAADCYAEAGSRLLAKKQTEEALNAFNQALELRPLDLTALNGATSATIEMGFPDEAAERLEKAHELSPESDEILSLLAHSYVEAANSAAAETAVARLIEREPSSYKRHLDVVRLYLKENNVIDAARVLNLCGEMLISNNQEEELLHWLDEVLARDPEQIGALKLLTRVRAWQRNEVELKNALERLAESGRLNGAEAEERAALKELRTLFPEDERYVTRLLELGEYAGTPVEYGSSYQMETNGHVPTFESFDKYGEEQQGDGYDWQDAPAYSANPFVGNDETEQNGAEFEFAGNVAAFPVETVEFTGNGYDSAPEINSEISEDFGFSADSHDWAVVADAPDDNVDAEQISFETPTLDAKLQEELEGIDYYISQGFNDIALESLDQLERQFGSQPAIQTRREKIAETAPQTEDRHEFVAPPQSDMPAAEPQSSITAATGFEDLFAELGEDLEVAALSTAQTADYETHYNLGLAYKDMGLYDDAVEEFQNAVKLSAPGDGTPRYLQCCNLIGHCFMEKAMPKLAIMWLQRGLDAPGHTDDEYQALRYELGTAYEMAGEQTKALELFAGIYAVNVAYRSVGDKVRMLQAA